MSGKFQKYSILVISQHRLLIFANIFRLLSAIVRHLLMLSAIVAEFPKERLFFIDFPLTSKTCFIVHSKLPNIEISINER